MDVLEAVNYGLLSILPPLIAIVLALITKEVISSLLTGILVGALIYNNGNVIEMVVTSFEVMGEKMGENVYILIFLGLLGALVAIVAMGGGSAAYGEMAARKIKTRRGASLATSALGCFIFIDDYFNCLTVGTVMKPLTDKHRISRAKLAYLIDATAAPICIIAPISSWGASVATYIEDAGAGNGMTTFIKIIPYNLYAILTIIMVIIICLSKVNFGSMARFEKNAIEHGDLFSGKEVVVTEVKKEKTKGKVIDLVIPIISLIVLTVLAMAYTGGGLTGETNFFASFGECEASLSLVLGSFGALVLTFIQYSIRKILSFREFMEGISEGVKSMVPAFTILILAWAIGGICSVDYLNTGGYVGNLVKDASFPVFILPVMVFAIAAFLGFATGTSWGTMALLIPIGVAICSSESTSILLYPVLGAVLAGSVYGDHISPISDTTILSSTGAGCNHIDHVSTQLVYASVVAVCGGIGYLLMGIMKSLVIPFAIALILLVVSIFVLGRISNKKDPIDYTKVNN
ncbi:Na+/H+ antiporter NhaC family protein [Anaerosporobacter sp.]